ncbi:hypothetical protein [Rubrivirga sp.]|uniref:hypothetical protein n=1 Tax=Rubrivirga sp. TaxID=1885344 RepID=UPI003C7097F9
MRLFLASLLLTATASAQTWDYDVALDSAYTLARADDLEGALDWYEVAFSRAAPTNPFVPFGAAEDAMRVGRPRQAVSFLHLAAKTGFASVLYAHRVDSFEPLRGRAWDGWIDAVHRAQALRLPDYDEASARDVIRLALEAERVADQRHDLEGDSTLSDIDRESRVAALDAVDHAVASQAVVLFEDRGWPRESVVGEAGAESARALIGRLPPDGRERFLPAYRAAVEDGEADADRYIEAVDQHRVDTGHPQLYGTAFWWDDGAEESVSYPLEDGADEQRAELGLASLREWFDRMSRSWPPRFGWPTE